jgi:23S rRNA pseudouridine1911/1915/1917 synthase
MAIAKSSKSAARISAQFRERAVTKIYVALCLGKFGTPEGELAQALVRDGCLTRLARERESGTLCRLRYQVIDTGTIDGTQVSKLAVRLITGFKHQIRAQLASVGHPIYGDAHYGAPKIGPDSEAAIGLCSCQLSFSHPISEIGRAHV